MSLINDALKRAKQSQRQSPPSGAMPLPPVVSHPQKGNGWMLVVAVVLFLGAGGLFIGAEFFKHSAPTVQLAQNQANPAPAVSAPAVAPTPAPAPAPAPAAPTQAQSQAPESTPPAETTAATAPAPTPDESPPSPPADEPLPSVQGIIFDANHPMAIVNGKSVSEGNYVGMLLVKQILNNKVVFQWPNGSQKSLKIGE